MEKIIFWKKSLVISIFLLILTLAVLEFGFPFSVKSIGTTYYVDDLSTNCTSAGGSGTIADPYGNLFYALNAQTYQPGDNIVLR